MSAAAHMSPGGQKFGQLLLQFWAEFWLAFLWKSRPNRFRKAWGRQGGAQCPHLLSSSSTPRARGPPRSPGLPILTYLAIVSEREEACLNPAFRGNPSFPWCFRHVRGFRVTSANPALKPLQGELWLSELSSLFLSFPSFSWKSPGCKT